MIKMGLCRINEHRMLPPEAIATNYIFTSVLFERVIESCTIIHSTCDSCDPRLQKDVPRSPSTTVSRCICPLLSL